MKRWQISRITPGGPVEITTIVADWFEVSNGWFQFYVREVKSPEWWNSKGRRRRVAVFLIDSAYLVKEL